MAKEMGGVNSLFTFFLSFCEASGFAGVLAIFSVSLRVPNPFFHCHKSFILENTPKMVEWRMDFFDKKADDRWAMN